LLSWDFWQVRAGGGILSGRCGVITLIKKPVRMRNEN
jgi:hypothetical protein